MHLWLRVGGWLAALLAVSMAVVMLCRRSSVLGIAAARGLRCNGLQSGVRWVRDLNTGAVAARLFHVSHPCNACSMHIVVPERLPDCSKSTCRKSAVHVLLSKHLTGISLAGIANKKRGAFSSAGQGQKCESSCTGGGGLSPSVVLICPRKAAAVDVKGGTSPAICP